MLHKRSTKSSEPAKKKRAEMENRQKFLLCSLPEVSFHGIFLYRTPTNPTTTARRQRKKKHIISLTNWYPSALSPAKSDGSGRSEPQALKRKMGPNVPEEGFGQDKSLQAFIFCMLPVALCWRRTGLSVLQR